MPRKVRPVPDEMRDIGARIVEWRNEIGLNQAELAARAGIDATVLNRVEKRKQQDPTASFVLRVAKALGRSTDSLLGRAASTPVALIADPGVPRELVEATAREIVARVMPLIPSGAQKAGPESPGPSRKLGGPKRHARKA